MTEQKLVFSITLSTKEAEGEADALVQTLQKKFNSLHLKPTLSGGSSGRDGGGKYGRFTAEEQEQLKTVDDYLKALKDLDAEKVKIQKADEARAFRLSELKEQAL